MPFVRQPSFHGGEVSPTLFSRTDIASRRYALKTLRNFLPLATGAAINRPGFKYVAAVKDQTRRPRLVPFTFSTSQAYLIEFGHLYIRVYQGGSVIADLTSTYQASELAQLQYVQSNDTLTLTHPAHAAAELKRTGASTWTLSDISVAHAAPTPTGLQFLVAPTTTADSTHPVKAWDWVCTSLVNSEESMPTAALSSTCQLAPDRPVTVGVASVAGATLYYWYRGRYGIWGYVGSSVTPSFVDEGQTPNYSDKPPTQNNPFASGENPAVATYFQQRRGFANTPSYPQRVLLSKVGHTADFDYSIPQKKDDSLDFTVSSRRYEEIRALVPMQQLVILTANTEFIVDAGGSPLAFDAFQLLPVGYNGCSWVPPLIVGDSILFTPNAKSSVRELVFGGVNGWAQGEVSLSASHLLAAGGHTISEWTLQRLPFSTIWAVRDDGILLSLTYDKTFGVQAWAHHDTNGGADIFESVASIPEGNEDVLYAVVNRTINGATARYIERLAQRTNVTTSAAGNFLDCSTETSGQNLTGLGYLQGRSVYAVRDGVVEGPFVVPAGGTISLSTAGTRVVVGLSYDSDLELLDLVSEQDGAVGPEEKLVSRAVWEVDNTAGLSAGESFGDLIPWTPELGWTAPSGGLAHEQFVVRIDSSWNRYGRAVMRSSKFPVSVLGATREIVVGS